MKAFEDLRQRGRSLHSAPRVFWSVDCSPTLYQGLAVMSAWARSPAICLLGCLDVWLFLASLGREA